MTTRRIAQLTLAAVALLAVAVALSIGLPAPAQNASAEGNSAAPPRPSDSTVVQPPVWRVLPTVVEPPAFVQIPADLISTPEPVIESAALPMMSNIPSQPRDGGVVYLTFDDGPNAEYTNQILDLLAAYNAQATFFVLGSSVDALPGTAARIVNEGHAIGNHTYWHEALPNETADHVHQTLAATTNTIARATGHTPGCMRPPYGALDRRTFDLITSAGYSVAMWEVDSEDWKTRDAYVIASQVLAQVNLGDRVLFHDGPSDRAATVSAVEMVLKELSGKGVRFAALPDC